MPCVLDKRGKGSYEENTGDAENKQQDGATEITPYNPPYFKRDV
jgi:hypothetical protein